MVSLPDWATLPPTKSRLRLASGGPPSSYGEAALDAECRKVATAANGTRNDTLNKAAFSLAQLVAGGELDEATVRRRLEAAAITCGLERAEIAATIDSGFSSGLQSPRTAPASDRREASAEKRSTAPVPRFISARELCEMEFPPIRYVVPGYIAEGLTLFAGRPKLGKSWLCMEFGLAVAHGGVCLGGVQCEQGDVLYLALEDNRRRLQSRIQKLWQSETIARIPVPDRLHLATEWPRANDGGVAAIREWIDDHPDARLVIVDVLAMFKAVVKGRDQTLYEADYQAIKELQGLAMETGVAIVVVHHTRKSGGEADPFEKVSGTLGLSGAADTTIILDRDQNGCTLYGRGRDIEEIETAVQFDKLTCRWRALGNAQEVRRTDERAVILNLLADNHEDNQEGMSPAEIADALGLPRNNVKQLLFKMAKAGEVVKTGKKGRYSHPDHAGHSTGHISPDNPDNRDNRRYWDDN